MAIETYRDKYRKEKNKEPFTHDIGFKMPSWEYSSWLEKEVDRKAQLIKEVRKFMDRLPAEWFPETLVALMDEEK